MHLQKNYYFKQKVPQIQASLTNNYKHKKYDNIQSLDSFTEALSRDIYTVARDRHIYFRRKTFSNGSAKTDLRLIDNSLNQGIKDVKVLEGNVGYLELTEMGDFENNQDLVASVFTFLQNTQGLIIDIRKNGGGSYSRLITSYLIPEDSMHLITYIWNNGEHDSIFTYKKLMAPRYLNKPVYILTSAKTFSSAEEFVYDLKALKRIRIVGEKTKGGANPNQIFKVFEAPNQFTVSISIPIGTVVNTITKANWEGEGIMPDIEITPEKAFPKAYVELLKTLQGTPATEKINFKDLIENINKELL